MNDITWAPIIPLIGGLPLGAEAAMGKNPEAIYSYAGFQGNDSHYVNYKGGVEYIQIDENMPKRKVNIIVATPPCAGLSQLNTGKSESAKGATADVNKWMYQVLRDGVEKFDADVIIGENAPALYTNKGKPVADEMLRIAREYGYSMSLYKTTTSLHGIPQNRDRTFYFYWKSDKAPIMNWYKEPRKNFLEHISEIDDNTLQQDLIINPKIGDEPYFNFIKHHTGKNPRDMILGDGHNTAFNYVNKNGLLEQALEWFKETNDENGIKYATHALKKFSQGLGIWDGSTHVFGDAMNAVIGRNMNDTIHPIHDRSLTIREALHMMGFPHDFELLGGRKNCNHIAQNVPVCTAKSMVQEAVKFLNGELEMSNTDFVKQNNHNQTTDVGNIPVNTLEEFF